jgi:hypothetical protein
MNTIHSFRELNITTENKVFVGKSIEVEEIQDQEIIVHDYKLGPSKFTERGNGKCLTMQIEYEGAKRVVFSGSGGLMDMIEQVPKDRFPFKTTIVKEKETKRLKFT